MKLGVIGADSSHLPEFSRRMNELHASGVTPCRVEAFWTDGRHDWPNASDVASWDERTRALGVSFEPDLGAMLGQVDGVLVLAVSGARHLELARAALERGLPTYIDKPLACDLGEAREILELSTRHGARCYSASSLRFITELESLPRESLGELVAIDAWGPGELNEGAPGVLHYGVHTIEMVDAIWGPGVARVSAVATHDRHLVDLAYHDGRYASLRLERKGAYDFGAVVHGTNGVHAYRVDFGPVYDRLVRGMARFFEGGAAPASLRDIVENVAVMVAANESVARDGAWIDVEPVGVFAGASAGG